MKINNQRVFEGRNIYSHRKCIRIDLDLEEYYNTPTKDIPSFNEKLLEMIPELFTHRCGIDEDRGFVKRLKSGTYLAHVCEHITIAISNKLGMDVKYGKAREISKNLYYVIYEYELKNTALYIGNLAVDIINSLIYNMPINYNNRITFIKNIMVEEYMGPSTTSIYLSAKEKELPILQLGTSGIYQIGYGKQGRRFSATIGHNTNGIGIDVSCDKLLTKELLSSQCLPVAVGEKIYNTIQLLEAADRIGYPVVLKPQFGNHGRCVSINIGTEKALLKAYKEVSKECKDIIIEKYVVGKDYRVCVINYKVIAVSLRIPPYIIGDGSSTIKELVDEVNKDPQRGENHERPLTKIKFDSRLIECLKKQKLNETSVIPKNQKVYLRENANLSTGGLAEDCTDIMCKENIEICERTAKLIGLDICGIDICSEDISKPLKETGGVIFEVNAAPGIRMHHYPSKGKSRNVADKILDTMYNGNYSNIPLISVTGTNGKTTTVRLIAHVLSLIGYNVGKTTTDGIYIGNTCIHEGDDTGVESARTILLNPDVDIAVLETARGGMIRRGLAYDLADVGVITNITEDHLGLDGIETLEDLSFVKSLIAEAVKNDGYAVINGDDEYSIKILDRIKSKKIIFSMNRDNKIMRENISQGNPGVYVDADNIIVENMGKRYTVCNVNDMPSTLGGKLKYNISNALAACGALVGIDVDYCIIAKGFKEFKLDEEYNIGRFNEYNVNGVKVILDYAHNIEGYKAVIESLKEINYNRVIGVIGVPGDREDSSIVKIGRICGEFFEEMIVKEDRDKRGRKDNEIAKLLTKGITKSKGNLDGVETVLDEGEALKKALLRAKEGDVIIVFYEDFNYLNNIIKSEQEKISTLAKVVEL